jgi:transcriptional regulator with XRE-family HTH domain
MPTPLPNRIREWRRLRSLTLQALAEGVGTTKSQIDKLEKGARRLTVEWMVRLAKPLACDPRDLLAHESLANATTPIAMPAATIPVKQTLPTSEPGIFQLREEAVDQVPRPAFLAQARDAYALYAMDAAMAPMYRPGQVLFVTPHKPPQAGCGVVVFLPGGKTRLAELIENGPETVRLRLYGPKPRRLALKRAGLRALHAIAGATEPQ